MYVYSTYSQYLMGLLPQKHVSPRPFPRSRPCLLPAWCRALWHPLTVRRLALDPGVFSHQRPGKTDGFCRVDIG